MTSSRALVVAGTDTNIGKTVVAAMLSLALDAAYWKPIQSGMEDGTDTERVKALTGLPEDRFIPETYRFCRPLSPHRAAELDGMRIDPANLRRLPEPGRVLVVELVGGLSVPLAPDCLQIDLLKEWKAPVALVARTSLGTINHTLLSLEALKGRGIPVLGVAFVGESQPDSEGTIARVAGVKRLGRLPILPKLTSQALRRAFEENFSAADFAIMGTPYLIPGSRR